MPQENLEKSVQVCFFAKIQFKSKDNKIEKLLKKLQNLIQ